MITRLHLALIVALSIVFTAIVLVIFTQHREQDYYQQQLQIQKAMVEGAAKDISYRLTAQIKNARLFGDEYRELIRHLTRNPDDDYTFNVIEKRLQQRFPNVSSFTIASGRGVPLLEDVEARVGEVCQRDIASFSTEVKRVNKDVRNPVFIHPQAGNYHYDIMSSFEGKDGFNKVFFASFDPKPIQQILKSREIPGHRLMLVKTDDDTLVEVSSDGTRDIMAREARLTKEEQMSIKASKALPGTNWTMVDIQDSEYFKSYIDALWKEAGILLLIVALSNILIFFIISIRIKVVERRENQAA